MQIIYYSNDYSVNIPDNSQNLDNVFLQAEIFAALATNFYIPFNRTDTTPIQKLDQIMAAESTFYCCRAMRRLCLGIVSKYNNDKKILNNHSKNRLLETKIRTVLIVKQDPEPITLNTNIQKIHKVNVPDTTIGILSLEMTDKHFIQHSSVFYNKNNSNVGFIAHIPRIIIGDFFCHVNYSLMFRFIARYLSSFQIEDCYNSFLCTLPTNELKILCTRGYHKLSYHLLHLPKNVLPTVSSLLNKRFHIFNICQFLNSWPSTEPMNEIKKKVVTNIHSHYDILNQLFCIYVSDSVFTFNEEISNIIQMILYSIPDLKIIKYKKGFDTESNKIILLKNTNGLKTTTMSHKSHQSYTTTCYVFPKTQKGIFFRISVCMSIIPSVYFNGIGVPKNYQDKSEVTSKINSYTNKSLENRRAFISLLERVNFAPKDSPYTFYNTVFTIAGQSNKTCHIEEQFQQLRSISVNTFKVIAFNTNKVINTKVQCFGDNVKLLYPKLFKRHNSIINIPRLTNNFVIRKYAVKEPSFTVSLFYTENFSDGVAINININGGYVLFLYAVSCIRQFLSVKTIFPFSIANWNSTIDLHGLENQGIVRNGRNDVFWTTNFPSVVSSKNGVNFSWFKAATATISKVYGSALDKHLTREVTPIVTHREANINPCKNKIFTLLESRNCCQIQVAHKRFLECLFECTSFYRLDPNCLLGLCNKGLFDFSKKIASHSKNKHECALIGIKYANSIAKLTINKRKVRLDNLGRNSNFISFFKFAKLRREKTELYYKIKRHIKRRLGTRGNKIFL